MTSFNLKAIALIFFLLSPCLAGAQENSAKIDELLSAYAKLHQFNGTALVSKNGQVIYQKSFGYKNAATKEAITRNSIFQIGSLTKNFTAALILKLAEQHKLSVEDTIGKYLPGFPRGGEIKIEHLLTHSSGLYEIFRSPAYLKDLNSREKVSPEKLITYFKNEPLDFPPGTAFSYCNSGYDLLGFIIEKVTGLSYGKAMESYILKPFKMDHSGFDFQSLSDPDKTIGYSYVSESKQRLAPSWNPYATYSSGALYSTVDDLKKWYQVLRKNQFISAKSFDEATRDHISGYGYGWFIDSLKGKKIINHSGNVEGGTSCFIMEPDNNISIILLNNLTTRKLEPIGNAVLAILLDAPYKVPQAKKPVVLDDEALNTYVGKYNISPTYQVSISRVKDQLYFQLNDQKPVPMFAEKKDVFFLDDDDMEIRFKELSGNKMNEIKISQGVSNKSGERL